MRDEGVRGEAACVVGTVNAAGYGIAAQAAEVARRVLVWRQLVQTLSSTVIIIRYDIRILYTAARGGIPEHAEPTAGVWWCLSTLCERHGGAAKEAARRNARSK